MIDGGTFNRINTTRAVTVKRFESDPVHGANGTSSYDYYDDEYYYSDQDDAHNFGGNFEEPKKQKTAEPLTTDQLLLCSATVRGFALSEKKWCLFFVDRVSAAQFSEQAFDQLVLPGRHKALVRALVESHVKESNNFDDFIKGKGKGLITILHGPPGVGKTLTAEVGDIFMNISVVLAH